jgi:hypothetical protein
MGDDRVSARARKNHATILAALADVGQKRVAELIDESETTISRSKGDLERCAAIMAAVGLKVVPVDHRTYSEDRIRALNTLARIGLDATDTEPGALDE